ncbi:MAG: hypothetical protein AAFN92_02970, partial [Bacteroidota bacterium]
RWIVNGKDFAFSFSSLAPLTEKPAWYDYDGVADQTDWDPATQVEIAEQSAPTTLGVSAVGIARENFKVQPVFRLTRDGTTQTALALEEEFLLVPIATKYPSSLWSLHLRTRQKMQLGSDETLVGTGGYRIVGRQPPKVKVTHAFPVHNLEFEQSPRLLPADGQRSPSYTTAQTSSTPDTRVTDRKNSLVALGFAEEDDNITENGRLADAVLYAPFVVRAY